MNKIIFGLAFWCGLLAAELYSTAEEVCWKGVICKPWEMRDMTSNTDKSCCRYKKNSAERDSLEPSCIDCVRVEPGNLNIIITVPHGGRFQPSNVKDRQRGCYNSTDGTCIYRHICPDGTDRNDTTKCKVQTLSDYRSDEVAFKIHDYILEQTGKCPTVVMSVLHRKKLDPNRNDTNTNGEATFEEEVPKIVYKWYHGNVSEQISHLNGEEGVVFALHGYNSKNESVKWTALGYSISKNDLNSKTSEQLDAIEDRSSIKRLLGRLTGTETLSSLLYGPNSFGAYLEEATIEVNDSEAVDALPSPKNIKPSPNDDDYFAATTSPTINDHVDKIDAIQAEIHAYYRNNDQYREAYQTQYAKAFGNAAIKFYAKYYDVCISNPCNNGEICISGSDNSYTCSGQSCEAEDVQNVFITPEKSLYFYNECVIYTCDDGFNHNAGNLTRFCSADGSWSGTAPTCGDIADACSSKPCENGGDCTASGDGYTCTCLHGYNGKNCQYEISKFRCYAFTLLQKAAAWTIDKNPFDSRNGQKVVCERFANKWYDNCGHCKDHCCEDQNECDQSPCTEECRCFNLQLDYVCRKPVSGIVCTVRQYIVHIRDKYQWVDALATFGSSAFLAYKLARATMIATVCGLWPHCVLLSLSPGSTIATFGISADDFSDPMPIIQEAFISRNITYAAVASVQRSQGQCDSGQYMDTVTNNCLSCPSGTYSDNVYDIPCFKCQAGSYQDEEGQSSCKPCTAGYFSSSTGSDLCDPCPVGHYSGSGATVCQQCDPGFVAQEAQSNCTACDPGTAPDDDMSQCVNCLVGTYSGSGIKCVDCDPGFVANEAQSSCTECGPGTAPNADVSQCVNCSSGTFSQSGLECLQCDPAMYSTEGSASCSLCNNGSVPNSDQSGCTICNPGFYAVSGFEVCKQCEKGTYSALPGQAECIPCNAGYKPNSENTGCIPCPPGRWSNRGDHECRPCEAGSISPGGQPNCTECEAGTAPNEENSECLDCPAGFNSSSGDPTCSLCPRDLWSSPGSEFCEKCAINEIPLRNRSGCIRNIAYGQKTKQKSNKRRDKKSGITSDDSGNAVDGDFYDTCSHTKKSKKTWWHVNLGGWYNVTQVVIQNAADFGGDQLHDIAVFVKGKKNLCGTYKGPAATGERVYIDCDSPVIGKGVIIKKMTKGKKESLILCEVFVLGTKVEKPGGNNSSSDDESSSESEDNNSSHESEEESGNTHKANKDKKKKGK